jgi:phosphatidyl-myo-inositol dimannoside synthase
MGAALGVSGGGSLSGKTVGEPSLRVLALVTDAFGEDGGIAEYNRHFLSSLAACDRIGDVAVLPRVSGSCPETLPLGVRQLRPVQPRLAYSLSAFRTAVHGQFDVVFCGHLFMAPLAAAIARLIRARLWVQVHGIEAWQPLSGQYRRSVETAALVTSVSRYTRRRLLEWIGTDPGRVKVLPNTVDPRFQPGPKPGYLLDRHGASGKKVLMTVSRLASSEQYKGHDRVIRAMPRVLLEHPEAIYVIVGDGDDRPRLEVLAAECGVAETVAFAGRVAPDKLPDYYRLADLFVMPSTGEGFGIVFLEAMASGTPAIGGNKDGSLDPLGDGALGTAIDPEGVGALASAICAALRARSTPPERAGRFSQSAFSAHVWDLVGSLLLPMDLRHSGKIGAT